MEFEQQFELDFMRRTLSLVQGYEGPFDATLLLNCLLGLLIVPKESSIDKIPLDWVSTFKNWGISPSSIKQFGNVTKKNAHPDTLRGFVWNLRNAAAHFHFEPTHDQGVVKGFRFHDMNGFRAEIDLTELRDFVERLSKYLEKRIQ